MLTEDMESPHKNGKIVSIFVKKIFVSGKLDVIKSQKERTQNLHQKNLLFSFFFRGLRVLHTEVPVGRLWRR